MSKRNVHIENLQIRLRGISPETARTAVGDLGHEILDQLTTRDQVTNRDRTPAGELRQRIAEQIVGSIVAPPRRAARYKKVSQSMIPVGYLYGWPSVATPALIA